MNTSHSPAHSAGAPTQRPTRDVFSDGLIAAAVGVFAEYQVTLAPDAAAWHEPMEVAAVIGFASDDMRGALCLATCRSLVRRSRSFLPGEPDDQSLADWLGELSNQVLGNLKKCIAPWGPQIYLTTPVVLWGVELRLSMPGNRCDLRRSFTSDVGALDALLQLQTQDPDALLTLQEPPPGQPAVEDLFFI